MRETLEQHVAEMVDKGIRYEDAQRQFEKRFISRVVQQSEGNLSRAADTLGVFVTRTPPASRAPSSLQQLILKKTASRFGRL